MYNTASYIQGNKGMTQKRASECSLSRCWSSWCGLSLSLSFPVEQVTACVQRWSNPSRGSLAIDSFGLLVVYGEREGKSWSHVHGILPLSLLSPPLWSTQSPSPFFRRKKKGETETHGCLGTFGTFDGRRQRRRRRSRAALFFQ